MLDVVTIGSSTVDFFIETDFPLIPWETTLGKALAVPFGEKFSSNNSLITTGGNAVNAAITFARQGLRVGTCIKLGLDVPGEVLEERLRLEGIKNKFVVWDSSAPTSRSVILLKDGERSIITYQGSGAELLPKEINFKKMRAKWWYVSLSGASYKLFPAIAKKSWELGVRLAVNPTKHQLLDGKKQLLDNMKYVDFLIINESEASLLTGAEASNEADILRRLDKIVPGLYAVTYGSKGSIVSDGERIFRAGVFKEKKTTDRTGAGDAYGSGFVAGLIRSKERCGRFGYDPEKIKYAIRLATANASSVVEKLGGSEGVLYRKDFDGSAHYEKFAIDVKKVK
jgi:ribokinase